MAITTKQTLSNKKFRQATLDELNLNGKVIIGGELSLTDGNQAIGKIITSDENGKFVWTQTGIANGVATLDGDRKLVQNIDASKITSGKIDIDRIPNGALERLIRVNNQVDRFLLTTNDVQNGDTVKQLDTGVMYRVIDETNLNNSLGYEEYTAGRATAVDWTGIENKPNDLTDLSTHQITELANINSNTVIGNDLATANSPKEIAIGENEFLGRLLGENIKGVEAINMYGLSSTTKTLIENNSNWNSSGVYIGSTITDAKAGQKHFDVNYLYEFVTDSVPIRTLRYTAGLAEVATTGSYYDLVDIPEYYTIVVHNITEFVAATVTLQGSAGTILLANHITLTSNLLNVNLQNIKIDGNGNSINFYNGSTQYYLQTNSSKITFENVALRGIFEVTMGSQKILEFGSSGVFIFREVTFRNLSKYTNNLTQTFGTNIQFNNSANLFIIQCRYLGFINDGEENNSIFPVIFNLNPPLDSLAYLHIFLNDYRNVLGLGYIGFTGNFANKLAERIRYNDLTRDRSVEILTGDSYLDFAALGSEHVYGKSMSEKDYWYGTQVDYDTITTKDPNTIYFIPEP